MPCNENDFEQDKYKTPLKKFYLNMKSEKKIEVVCNIIVLILLSFAPIAVIYAMIDSYDENNSTYWFLAVLIFGGALFVLAIVWHTVINNVIKCCDEIKKYNKIYLNLISKEELNTLNKKKRNKKIIACGVIGVVFAGIITVYAVNAVKVNNKYEDAVWLVDKGDYKEAEEIFYEIEEENFKDTAAYIKLCEAHIDYDSGYYATAHWNLEDVRFYNMSDRQLKKFNEFKSELNDEYDAYIKNAAEKRAQAYRDKIAYGVPYVGMSESEIKNTSLGAPSSEVRHNSEMINGERYIANLYDFKCNGSRIFTARCVKGRVTEVWDYRDNPKTNKSTGKSTKKKQYSDPYDVDDYFEAEDFYYDHYDDFYDYEDAESYYYEHHK